MTTIDFSNGYDASTWLGHWPFRPSICMDATALKNKLMENGIEKAMVSTLEAAFSPDPLISSLPLFDTDPSFFIPVPVVDPSRTNWTKLSKLIEEKNVRAVKLMPNYHRYDFSDMEKPLGQLVAMCEKKNIVISIQARLEDERGQYPALLIKSVSADAIQSFTNVHPKQTFLINGLYTNEIGGLAESRNVYIDVSALDSSDVYASLLSRYPTHRLVFATHTPLFFPQGNTYKLAYASISDQQKKVIAHENFSRMMCESCGDEETKER